MKQFQKYGVAAAVATLATGAYAQTVTPEVSSLQAGDLAIVPYYTVLDGKNTGIHIINTTDATQVVKVRLRRGADSADALDFNVIMSPRDEWTANIGAGGTTGVRLTTNDTTCTVPSFKDGVAQMPPTFSAGATEGYVEIIGMAQAAQTQPIAVAAKHATKGATEGVPADCASVRSNFFRVANDSVGNAGVKGTHTSNQSSNGACSTAAAAAAAAAGSGACTGGVASNLSDFTDTPDQALKVSYMITDSTEGLEVGGNAVHVEGFSEAPMLTNQQPLSFGSAGIMQYDPLNFELPNLAYGALPSSVTLRKSAGADGASEISDGTMFSDLRLAMDTQALVNDWASFESGSATVATDWVVTLPGQYAMNNNVCASLTALAATGDGPSTKGICNVAATPVVGKSLSTAAFAAFDQDELPLTLASNVANSNTGEKARLLMWDREEKPLNSVVTTPDADLGFSPGGAAGTPTDLVTLNREVNVIVFDESATSTGVLGSAEKQDEALGLRVYAEYTGKGWGELQIEPVNSSPKLWTVGTDQVDDDADVNGNVDANGFGEFVDVWPNTPAVGFAVWERNFADQAGNYGRLVEHSTVVSSGGRI